jgi:hypothetical protein
MKRLLITALVGAALTGIAAFALAKEAIVVNFDDMEAGEEPDHFSFCMYGEGEDEKWVVRDDVLVQTSNDRTDRRYPIAYYEREEWRDVIASVRFKTLAGETSQLAGIVFRGEDDDTFYSAEVDVLTGQLRLMKTDGERVQLAAAKVRAAPGEWHTLGVKAIGNLHTVFLDGEKVCEAADDAFDEDDNVGLITKSDSVVAFDDLMIEPVGDEEID